MPSQCFDEWWSPTCPLGFLNPRHLRQSEVVPCTCLGDPELRTAMRRGPGHGPGLRWGPTAQGLCTLPSACPQHLRETSESRKAAENSQHSQNTSDVPGTGRTLHMSAGFTTSRTAVPFPARFLPTAGERQSQAQGVHSRAVPGVQSRPQPEKSCQRGAGHFLSFPSGQGTPGQKGQ